MHPWNITKDQLKANTPQLSADALKAILWAYNYSDSKGLSYVEFGAAADISGDTLRKIATGTYVDPRDTARQLDMPGPMVDAILHLRDTAARTAPTSVQFVFTETARSITENCHLARESRSPLSLVGASQIGKTTGLGKVRDANPENTWLVTATAGMGAKGLAIAICEELKVSASGSLATLTRRIGKTIPAHSLLIVDDFHVLTICRDENTFMAAMEFLRAVYGICRCGMVLSTTELDYSKVMKKYGNAMHQLLRRGVHIKNLGSQPQQKDVRAIIEAHGLKWPTRTLTVAGKKPWQVLANLAVNSGLTFISERLRYALAISSRQAVPVTWEHFMIADAAIIGNSEAPPNDWAA